MLSVAPTIAVRTRRARSIYTSFRIGQPKRDLTTKTNARQTTPLPSIKAIEVVTAYHQSMPDNRRASRCPLWVKNGSPDAQAGGPLCSQERTSAAAPLRSEKCEMVVGAPEQRGWQDNAQRLCGFQIQDQLELRGLLDRQVGHSLAFKNRIDKARGAAED